MWSGKADLLAAVRVLVRALGDNRAHGEVLGRRRRGNLPLESPGTPWIVDRLFTGHQRVGEVNQRDDVTDGENRSTEGRGYVQHLELRRVGMIPTGHAEVA